ncbi:MAG: HAMP domain-containing histidine kinase [Pseudomonadales bacterium]|nr:HAMP domain-containing histidine kinase [Pseudomonadales bacterium]
MMGSLQTQLKRSNLLVFAIALALFLWLTNFGFNKIATEYVVSRLQHDAENIIAALERQSDGEWQLDESRIGAVYGRVHSGHYYHLASNDFSLQSRSLWDHAISPEQLAPGETEYFIQPGFGDQICLVLEQGFRKDGTAFTLWVAEDIGPFRQSKMYFVYWAIGLIIGTLTILLVVQQWLLSRGFKRLDKIRTAIGDLRNGDENAMNFPLPDEVKPLADEIERLLIQLQRQVQRSRNSLGNLVHELKRPLQRMQLLAEPLDDQSQGELKKILENIQWLIERELKRARIVGVSSPGRHTVLDEEIPELTQIFEKIYPDIQLSASWPPSAILPHDRDDMLELLGNLIDNACKYGRGRVGLKIDTIEDGWSIEISDNGPGIPAAEIQEITRRGVRLDESGPGAGLGLAICKDIVSAWGGTLTLQSGCDAGGMKVNVTLPSPQQPFNGARQ